jgi:hypothetical protein
MNAIATCLIVLALGFSSPPASAGDSPTGMQVLGIEVGETNVLALRLSANTECGSPVAILPRTHSHYRDIFEMAMSAYSTGKDIRVWVTSCDFQRRGVIVRMALGAM